MKFAFRGGRRGSNVAPDSGGNVVKGSDEDRIATLDDILDGCMVNGRAGLKDAKKILESHFFKDLKIAVDLDCDEYKKLLAMENELLKSQQESFYALINRIPRHAKSLMRKRASFLKKIDGDDEVHEVNGNCDLLRGFERWVRNKILLKFDDILAEFLVTLDEIDAEKEIMQIAPFGLLDGVRNMMSNKYITSTWLNMAKQADPADVAQDIIAFNGNLALTGALIVTLAFPMYLDIQSEQYEEDWAFVIYTFAIVACGVLEAIVLLVAIRNIIAITLVDTENMMQYIAEAKSELVAPIKFNVLGVVALIISLLSYGYSTFGMKFFLYFLFVLTVPGFVFIFGISASGIVALHKVQPWELKKHSCFSWEREKNNSCFSSEPTASEENKKVLFIAQYKEISVKVQENKTLRKSMSSAHTAASTNTAATSTVIPPSTDFSKH